MEREEAFYFCVERVDEAKAGAVEGALSRAERRVQAHFQDKIL